MGPGVRGRTRGPQRRAVRRGSPARPHRDHQPDRGPAPRRLAGAVRRDARRALAGAHVAARRILPRQGGGAARAAPSPPGLRLPPGAQRQGGAGGASRRPDRRLDREALLRSGRQRPPARSPGPLRPRLPDRGRVPEPAGGSGFPVAGAHGPAPPCRPARGPAPVRPPDRGRGALRIPRRGPQPRRRAVHEALLPDHPVGEPAERAAAPGLPGAFSRGGGPGRPEEDRERREGGGLRGGRGRRAADQPPVPGPGRAHRSAEPGGVPAPSVRAAGAVPVAPAAPGNRRGARVHDPADPPPPPPGGRGVPGRPRLPEPVPGDPARAAGPRPRAAADARLRAPRALPARVRPHHRAHAVRPLPRLHRGRAPAAHGVVPPPLRARGPPPRAAPLLGRLRHLAEAGAAPSGRTSSTTSPRGAARTIPRTVRAKPPPSANGTASAATTRAWWGGWCATTSRCR